MAQSQYSLSWENHSKNFSNGLGYLQQNEEFVDMTLAADGHFVKVHQVIMALSSPFLKDLIASAQCPHPVIVLNKISHKTLSAIVEYIYTGEVLMGIEDIRELIDAAKELHIKGLQEMDLSVTKPVNQNDNEITLPRDASYVNIEEEEEEVKYYETDKKSDEIDRHNLDNVTMHETENMRVLSLSSDSDSLYEVRRDATVASPFLSNFRNATILTETNEAKVGSLQYTVSTHGSLQLILNRFLYFLKHTRLDQTRQWRCVDYLGRAKCPALVVTRDNVVLQRVKAHKHPFHDSKILKKVKGNNVFSELIEAEQSGANMKRQSEKTTNDS